MDLTIIRTMKLELSRSIHVYIGTPKVAAGLWKRDYVNSIEARVYREVKRLPNVISRKVIKKWTVTLEKHRSSFLARNGH